MVPNDLKKVLQDLAPILEAVSDAIQIQDLYGNVIFQNTTCQRMFKRESVELVSDIKEINTDSGTIGTLIVYHDHSEINRLRGELSRLNQKLRKVQKKYTFQDVIGENEVFTNCISRLRSAAITPASVLIEGERGCGKELCANAVHNSSPRRNNSFIKIDCESLSSELLEKDLFGFFDLSYGGRRANAKGLLREANRGTLLLIEVGNLSLKLQEKLLNVLERKTYSPINSEEEIQTDFRLICTSRSSLKKQVEKGAFLEKLYRRVSVFQVELPPLRNRKDDLKLLSARLITRYNEEYKKNILMISADAVEILQKCQWPGNVRELENLFIRVFLNLADDKKSIEAADIELAILAENELDIQDNSKVDLNNTFIMGRKLPEKLDEALEQVERECILKALSACNGDKNMAAEKLGIPIRTLYYRCKKLNIK